MISSWLCEGLGDWQGGGTRKLSREKEIVYTLTGFESYAGRPPSKPTDWYIYDVCFLPSVISLKKMSSSG